GSFSAATPSTASLWAGKDTCSSFSELSSSPRPSTGQIRIARVESTVTIWEESRPIDITAGFFLTFGLDDSCSWGRAGDGDEVTDDLSSSREKFRTVLFRPPSHRVPESKSTEIDAMLKPTFLRKC